MIHPSAEKAASDLYEDSMPYHNFNHALEVRREGDRIVKKCLEEGIDIDGDAVAYALLFHDAGFHENHQGKGFDSKEAYSAELAVAYLNEINAEADTIKKVEAAILSTHCDGVCSTNEDKAVRAADLASMAQNYQVFLDNSIKLKREYEMLSGKTLTWDGWKKAASERIELFLREDMALTSDYYNSKGESVFHRGVRENIQRLSEDEKSYE